MLACLHSTSENKKSLLTLSGSAKTAGHCLRLGIIVISRRVNFSGGGVEVETDLVGHGISSCVEFFPL